MKKVLIMNDFIINKLLARGTYVKDSELRFTKGVNLITGGSDTGKSYAFDLIDFLLGSSNEPNYIEERKGYTDFYLEITVNNKVFTLLRSLDNIKVIYVSVGSINDIDDKTTFEEYKVASAAKKSVSMFLLYKLGIYGKLYFSKNQSNKLQQLTFRSYIKSFMISEEKITAKSTSIIETELKYPKETFTREKFYYFLTKRGNKQKKTTSKKSQGSKNKIEILLEIKAEYEIIKKRLENKFPFLDKEEKIDTDIIVLKDQIQNLEVIINKKDKERISVMEEVKIIDYKIASNDMTIKRFQVLLAQYINEIERIDFVYKGESYLSQIEKAICPICNTELRNNHRNTEDIYIAYNAEKSKIRLKASDVKESINDIIERNINLANEKKNQLITIEKIENELNQRLKPEFDRVIKEYNELLKFNKNQTKYNLYCEEIKKIQEKIEILESINNSDNGIDENIKVDTTLFINRIDKLCEEMENMLEEFKFSDNVSVTYNEKEIDFIVNEQSRKSYGQGYSSIIYVSFVLALKKIMDKYSIETPNFIIFDSPFTSLTEGDEIKNKEIKVSRKIFDSFFTYCCKEYEDKQLIIFENTDDKYRNLDKKINYIHFTKNKDIGRYGFFLGEK